MDKMLQRPDPESTMKVAEVTVRSSFSKLILFKLELSLARQIMQCCCRTFLQTLMYMLPYRIYMLPYRTVNVRQHLCASHASKLCKCFLHSDT